MWVLSRLEAIILKCKMGLRLSFKLQVGLEAIILLSTDVDELKRRINGEWAALNHAVIGRTVGEWRQRLRACVRAGGGHFEHMM